MKTEWWCEHVLWNIEANGRAMIGKVERAMDSSVTLAEDLGDKDRLECNTLEKERKQLKYKQRERDRKGSNKF